MRVATGIGLGLLICLSFVSCAAPPAKAPVAFDLEEATVADLQARMASGRETARSIAEKYLARIEAIDRQGSQLRSVLEINPDALAIADALDAERKAKGPRGPLHGIPVLIKDNIATADRMTTTAGSLALEGSAPPEDAGLVRQLRAAGAVILGKTNLSEWANIRSTTSSSGWSGRGGQTKNPYALDRNPSGSSSGSAVAVAANLCALAIGTETDGSIVSPSSINGIVGIKPTVGFISRTGIIPIAHSQDTAGPMARTVADAATALLWLEDTNPGSINPDPAARARALDADLKTLLDPDGLKGARIGVARKAVRPQAALMPVLDRVVAELRKRGAVIVDPADFPHTDFPDELDVLLYELKADLNNYLAWLGPKAPVHSLADIIAFNRAHVDREMPIFGQELFEQAEAKGPLTDRAYLTALAKDRRLSQAEGIDALMKAQKLDAIVTLTGGPAWLTDHVAGDHDTGSASSPAAVAGYPHITVPAGDLSGLPLGLSFIGRARSEPTLIRLAYAYEQATKARRPPQFKTSVEAR